MITIQTIKTLSLISEIVKPQKELEKFHNSDKKWDEVDLGNNVRSLNTAFVATQIAVDPADDLHTTPSF